MSFFSLPLLWFRRLLVFSLLLLLLPVAARAQTISMSCSDTSIRTGESVTVRVSVSVAPASNTTVNIDADRSVPHAGTIFVTDATIRSGATSGSGSVSTSLHHESYSLDISISAPSGYSIEPGKGSCTVHVTGVTLPPPPPPPPTEALSFSRTSVAVEEGKTATYTVSLATRPTSTVTVAISRSSGDSDITVTSPSDGSLTFTTTNWNTGQEVTLSAAEDDDLTDGSATIGHTASGGGYNSVSGNVTATEDDDDSPALSFTRTSLSVPEGGTAAYSVSLAYQPSASVTVTISRSSGDSDITVTSPAGGSLTFTTMNWNTGQEVTLSAAQDSDGLDGQATITHAASGGGYNSVSGTVTATESDNDRAISVTRTSLSVPEGGVAKYSVTLATRPTASVTVAISRSSGDSDITVTSPSGGSLTFTTTNWNTGQEVTLSAAQDDDLVDGTAMIRHTASGGGYQSVTRTVTATEDDDDTAALSFARTPVSVPEGGTGKYSVKLAYEPSASVTVTLSRASGDSDITVTSPAGGSLTFTTMNWNTGQEVTLSAAEDDDGIAGQATIRHSASGGGYGSVSADVAATENDNDPIGLSFSRTSFSVPEGGMAKYSVSLKTRPSAEVTVTVSRVSGDTNLTVNKPSLTFTTSNWATTQEVTVSAAEDVDGLNGQATIRHTASGGDYGSVTADITATESDNDSPGLTLSRTSLPVPEGSTATYTVSLATEPSASVTVTISRSSGDSDLTVTSPSGGSLTFTTTNWYVTQQVTVSAAQDDDILNGQATIRHSASGGDYGSVTTDVTATEDDDDSPALAFTKTSVTVPEGGTATYSVSLAHQPGNDVRVSIARLSGDSNLSVTSPSGGSLTFTTTNWNTGQEVTLSAAEDDDLTDGSATIRHTASGGGYGSVTGDVTATEDDDDSPALVFTKTSVTVPEGGAAKYSVSLAHQPSASVALLIARSSGDSDLTAMPPSLTFTRTNWSTGQEVTLSAAHDDDLTDGSATIRHTAFGGGYNSVAQDVTATEDDDDLARLMLSRTSLTVPEGGTATYSLSLSYQPSASVTVTVAPLSGGDSDLTVTSPVGGSLTFTTTNWNTAQEVTLSVAQDDDLADGGATIRHTASGGGYGSVTSDVIATEDDDDSPRLIFTATSLSVPEGSTANYSVRLAYQPSASVTVTVAPVAGGDSDLTVTSPSGGSLTFTTMNWDTDQEVTLSAAPDNDIADGRATIRHTASGGGYGSVTGDVTATEDDDDTPALTFTKTSVTVPEGGTATYSVSLSYRPDTAVVVVISRTSGDFDISALQTVFSFSTTDWNVAQEVTLSAAPDDDLANGTAVFRHTALGGSYDSTTGDVTATEQDDDSARLMFTRTSVMVPEGGTATYSVSLSYQPSASVTVTVAPVSGGDSDLAVTSPSGGSLTFTTTNWNTGQEVTLSAAQDDDLVDGTATIRHTASGGGYGSVTGDVTATEDDDDSPGLVFTKTLVTVPEGATAAYSVSLSYQPSASVTVTVAPVSGGDSDLTVTSPSGGSLTFTTTNWNSAQEVTLSAAQDDDLADGGATIRHTASGGGYASVTGDVATTEDDDDTPALAFTKTSVTVPEGGTQVYSVSLEHQPSASVAVSVLHKSGDVDLAPSPPLLVFTTTNWNTGQRVTVRAAEDDDGADGSATIGHTALGGGYDNITGDVTATEDDNDSASLVFSTTSPSVPENDSSTYTLSLSTQPSASVTVTISRPSGDSDITVTSPAGGSLTFTTTNWNSAQEVTLSAADDDDLEDSTATIRHSAAGGGYDSVIEDITATEQDDDSPRITLSETSITVPEGGMATYSAKLANKPSAEVRVTVAPVPGGDSDITVTAPSGGSLTFTTMNWNQAQEIAVSAAEDNDIADGGATLRHTASGGDYAGVSADLAASESDNDTGILVLSQPSASVPEGGTAQYTVKLGFQPTGPVAVVVSRSSGDSDLSASPPLVSFTTSNWDQAQEITLSAAEDNDNTNGEAVIGHSALGGGYGSVSAELTATEQDNDSPNLVFSRTSFFVPEGSDTTYTVSLATEPSASVTVSVSRTAGDSDLSVTSPAGGSLTFSTMNWQTGQQVTIAAAEDQDATNGEATISHSALGGGYAGISGEVRVTESDNDAPGFTLSETELSVQEGDDAGYTIALATQPSGPVTVSVSRTAGDSDLSATSPSGGSLTFTTANWSDPQEITISAAEDDDGLAGEATFAHTGSGGGYDAVAVDSTAIEIDNDSPRLVITGAPLAVEEGAAASWTVRLSTRPSEEVRLGISRLSGDTDLSVASPLLTFTTTNWNVDQEVNIEAGEDDDGDNGEATFLHTATGGDYAGITAEATATEIDNDSAGFVFSETSIEIDENNGQDTYTLKLVTAPSGPVTVSILSRGPETVTVSPPSLSFTTNDWDQPKTITVTAVDDFVDSDRTTAIAHTASGGGYDRIAGDVAVALRDDETAGVKVDPEELRIQEGGGAFYTLELASEPLSPVAISVSRLGENVENLDWDPKRLTFSAADWNSPQRVTVRLAQDEDAIPAVALMRHSATSPDPVYSGIAIDDVEIVIGDDDQIVTAAVLSLDDDEIAEGEASAIVTVTATLDAVTTTEIHITLSLGGTATAQDYDVGGEHTITIDAGEARGQTVLTFVPLDDALVEGTETIIVNGSSPDLAVAQTTLNLIDDDTAVGEAVGTLSVDIDRVAESARDTLVTVALTLGEGFTFDEIRTFEVAVRGTGNDAAVDFTPVQPFTLTLLSNVSSAQSTFVLRPENDLVDEADETLTLSAVSSPLPVTPATITLVDDDAAPTGISLSVDNPDIAEGDPPTEITVTARIEGGTTYARAVTINLDLGGTATEGRDGDFTVSGVLAVTVSAGQGSAATALTFMPVDDSRDELDETIDITGTTPGGLPVTPTSVALLDNDQSLLTLRAEPSRIQEGGGPATVMLTVSVRSGTPYDEDLDISLEFAGTASPIADYTLGGPLTFTLPAGQVTASTSLTVTPIDDSLDEPEETLEIAGNAAVGYTSTAVVLIIDNDIPPARIQLTVDPMSLAETAPATRVLLQARVEGNTAFSTDTEIALTLEGSAIATVDYDAGGTADPLILPAGRLSVTRELNITPLDDPHPEGTEQIVITGATVVRVLPAAIALLDDDGADLTVSFTQAQYTANEYGAPATVTVTVTPTADRREVIDLTFSHLGGVTSDDYRGLPGEVVFEPGADVFSFTVEALPDEVFESGERIHLRLASLSPQVSFQPLDAATVLFVERRSAEEFSQETRTVLALSSRAWSDSVQSALEERFARTRQTEEWGGWQPGYQEPPASNDGRSPALFPQPSDHAGRIIPGDWLAAWTQQNERRNMGLIEPRLSLRKILARLKGWRPVLWAEGSTHHFSGHAQALDYQGAFQAAHVGLDLHSGKRTLIGASVMRGHSSMDYSNGQGLDGSTTATLYTIHPYLHFEARDRVTVWTIGGLGFAPLSLQELDRDHDLSGSARMAAGGVRIRAKNWGRRELAIRSDADFAWIGAQLPAESVTLGGQAGRVRVLAELTHTLRVFGQDLIAAGEAGGRLDRGGGHRGAGTEAGGRLSWRKPDKGLDFSIHGNSLLWHQSAFRLWGAGIQASWDPGAEKRGLVLRFASGRGPRGGKTRLFHETVDRLLHPADNLDSDLEVGYGTGVGTRLLTLTFRLRGLSGWTAAIDLR